MKIVKKETETGKYIKVEASAQDLIEADLMASFTRNQLYPSGYQLVQQGRVLNYLNNLLVTAAVEDGDMMLLAGTKPQFKVIGEPEKFAEFHFFYPRQGKKAVKSGSEDFEADYRTPFGNNLEQPDGWDYTTVKSDAKK